MSTDLADLDPAALLAVEEAAVLEQRRIERDRVRHLLAWHEKHSGDPQAKPGAIPARLGGDRLVQIGGEGTPGVSELQLEQFAIAARTGGQAMSNKLADALDLTHRLPRTWAAVDQLPLELWVARRVASLTRRLTQDQARIVDTAVAAAVEESASRILTIAEAKVIEADLDGHRQRIAAEERRKGVWVRRKRPGQRTAEVDHEADVQPVGMRLSTAGALGLKETVDQIAHALAEHHTTTGDDGAQTMDQLRAEAAELLADPYAAVRFLDGLTDDPSDPETPSEPEPPARKRPRRRPARILIHFGYDETTGRFSDVARVEGMGPMITEQVRDLLGGREVTLTPVIDLNTGSSVNAYEHPTACKDRGILRNVYDVFPHSTSAATTRLDHDHATPYDPTGPPGQTGDHNDAPLTRRHHRAKTHLGYRVRQMALDAYRWETPHGLVRVVTRRGTTLATPLRRPDGTLLGETYPTRHAIACDL